MLVSFSVMADDKDDVKVQQPEKVEKIIKEIKIENDGPPVEIIVPVIFFLTFPACMFLFYFFKFLTGREKQVTLRRMVESGAQIPHEMFMEGKSGIQPIEKDRKNGILFTLSSLGGIGFLLIMNTETKGLWAIGLIPLLTGIGYLINWKLAEAQNKKGERF